MKKYVALFLMTVLFFSVFGWSTARSRDYYSVNDHKDDFSLPDDPSGTVNVRSYQGIKTALLTFVKEGREKCVLNISDYEGNVSDAISEASLEIIHNTAIGAYAVDNITHSYTKETSYYTAEVNISYKHTAAQVSGIMYLNYVSAVQGAIGKALSDHTEYLVISISSELVTPDFIRQYALEYYRSNPISLLYLPEIKTTVFEGRELPKIIEIELSYPYSAKQDETMKQSLSSSASEILKGAKAIKEVDTAANACKRLDSASSYLYNGSSSAYGTIIGGGGNSEGYAMSYKLLCSLLGIRCTVVEGFLGPDKHFWNIIELSGEYYHVDPAMCDIAGLETAFLKSDAELTAMNYTWDTAKYKACKGSLKYEE